MQSACCHRGGQESKKRIGREAAEEVFGTRASRFIFGGHVADGYRTVSGWLWPGPFFGSSLLPGLDGCSGSTARRVEGVEYSDGIFRQRHHSPGRPRDG